MQVWFRRYTVALSNANLTPDASKDAYTSGLWKSSRLLERDEWRLGSNSDGSELCIEANFPIERSKSALDDTSLLTYMTGRSP